METINVDLTDEGFVRISSGESIHIRDEVLIELSDIPELILKLRKFQKPTRLEAPVE